MEGGNIRYWSYFLKISPLSPSLRWFIWHFLWLNLPLKYGSHLLRHFSLQSKASMWASTPQLPCGSQTFPAPPLGCMCALHLLK